MMNIKLALVILACVFSIDASFHNITILNATHIVNGSFYDPVVLKSRNELVYLSYPKVNANVTIHLESFKDVNTSHVCEMRITVPRGRDLRSPTAAALDNGKIVVAFVETRWKGADLDPNPKVNFYLLDPSDGCKNSQFSVPFDNDILLSYRPLKIIPYQNTFDVFAKSNLHCSPPGSICMIRYNDTGDTLGTTNFDFSTENLNFDLEDIHPLTEFDPTSGYIFTSKSKSLIVVLDSNLKTTKELKVSGFILAHSVLNGEVGVCSQLDKPDQSLLQCIKLDARLKLKSNTTVGPAHMFLGRRLYNLADGSSLLLGVTPGRIMTFVRRLEDGARISQPELYRYECESYLVNPSVQFTELKGGVYCFSFGCKSSMFTHCVRFAEAKNLARFA